MISKEIIQMEKICRSCMSESPQMRNVFEHKQAQEGDCLQLADMFRACTSIQIFLDDGLPIQLCQACEAKLDTAFEFKQQCEKTDSKLRQISNIGARSSSSIKLESLNIVVQPDLNTLDDINSVNSECNGTNISNAYICSFCNKVLRTKKGLVFHQRRHTGEQLRCCKICPAKFTRTNHLNRHLRIHAKSLCSNSIKENEPDDAKLNDIIQCSVENDTDSEVDDIRDEDYVVNKKKLKKEIHNDERSKNKENEKDKQVTIRECEFCDRKFKYKKSFVHHMQLEHGMSDESDAPFTCATTLDDTKVESEETLSQEFLSAVNSTDTKDDLIDHQSSDDENHAVEDDNKHLVPIVKRKRYTCHVCSVQFTRANHLTRHMTIHRAVLIHKCDKCEKAFATTTYLDKHIQEDHINKPYVCNVCNKKFSRGEQFIRHLRMHDTSTADENHKCSICEATFSRSDHLARHTKTHLQHDKRHVCGDCGKAFNRLDNLKTHQRTHSGIKDTSRLHLCVYCGKDFNSSSNMIVHMRRHTGERPYKCSICNKGFPRSHDLKCHERTHSGEKPYLCTLCGKSFNKSNKLLRHTRVHTGERPYVCNICGRAFTQSNDLALHMRRHTGARPYVCGVCPARFIQSGQLKAHRRSTNHWMDILPDLKGGHRVEQVTPITNPVPIKFKTHGKYELKLKDDEEEMLHNIKHEPRNVIQQVNIMGMENDLTVIPPPYVIDNSKLLPPPTSGGYLVFTSVFNEAEHASLDQEEYKADMQTCSISSVHSDDTLVDSSKIDVVNGSIATFSPQSSASPYSVPPNEHYNYDNYG